MAVKIVMMVMAMIVEIVMTVMILDGEEILGHVTIVTSFQVYDDNQRRNHRWGGSQHLAVEMITLQCAL